jgi:GNAT superfamily N-acetyltransferase
MTSNQTESFSTQLLATPSQHQIQVAAAWLATHPQQNPDLEVALHLILQHQILPYKQEGLLAIAHTAPIENELTQSDVQGVVIAKPGNDSVSIASTNRAAAEALLSFIQTRGCPQRICTTGQDKTWLRPLLLQHYQLQREYDQQVLVCTQAPAGGAGRWAVLEDKPALQAYAEAYLAERGTGSLNHPWDRWIQERRVAVLKDHEQVVAVVRRGETINHAIVVAPFTFPQFRRQGFARRLLAFFTQEMLQEFPAVKLWVDAAAIALYNSLNFQHIGDSYTGYFVDSNTLTIEDKA